VPTKARSISAPLNEDAIRDRAYLMWEADGRPDGMADHYWMKASEPAPDISAKPKAKATAAKTAAALKSAKPKGKAISPAEPAPAKSKPAAKTANKTAEKPKLKAAAAKVSAPAVKAKPAAKAPAKKAAKKA